MALARPKGVQEIVSVCLRQGHLREQVRPMLKKKMKNKVKGYQEVSIRLDFRGKIIK